MFGSIGPLVPGFKLWVGMAGSLLGCTAKPINGFVMFDGVYPIHYIELWLRLVSWIHIQIANVLLTYPKSAVQVEADIYPVDY